MASCVENSLMMRVSLSRATAMLLSLMATMKSRKLFDKGYTTLILLLVSKKLPTVVILFTALAYLLAVSSVILLV